MKKQLLLPAILLVLSLAAAGQTYPQYEKINQKSGEQIITELKAFASDNGLPELIIDLLVRNHYDVEAYRIVYQTRAANPYLPDVKASGVVFVPKGIPYPAPMAVYEHGTIGSEGEAPSRVAAQSAGSGQTLIEDQTLFGWVLATDGYIAVLPDYIGLGDEDIGDRFHPFSHARSEATATIDMMYAVRSFLSRHHPTDFQKKIFLSGYSQGGHAVMATQRMIESNRDYSSDFDIAISVPASGAYCLSSVQRKFLINTPDYSNPGHLPYLVFGYREAYGDMFYPRLNEVFVNDPMSIYNLYDGDLTIEDIDDQLAILHPGLETDWKTMFTQKFQDDFMTDWCWWRCPPIITALRDNDVVNWKPQAKTRMLFCFGDEVVAPENTLSAYLVFRMVHRAPDIYPISLGTNEHTACAIPSLILTKFLFDANQTSWKSKMDQSGIEHRQLNSEDALRALNRIGIFSLDDLKKEVLNDTGSVPEEIKPPRHESFSLYPNPANKHVYLELPDDMKDATITFYDVTGRVLIEKHLPDRYSRIDLSGLHNGMYIVRVKINGNEYLEKLVKE